MCFENTFTWHGWHWTASRCYLIWLKLKEAVAQVRCQEAFLFPFQFIIFTFLLTLGSRCFYWEIKGQKAISPNHIDSHCVSAGWSFGHLDIQTWHSSGVHTWHFFFLMCVVGVSHFKLVKMTCPMLLPCVEYSRWPTEHTTNEGWNDFTWICN